jgi:hypothetical protein
MITLRGFEWSRDLSPRKKLHPPSAPQLPVEEHTAGAAETFAGKPLSV